MSLFKVLYLSPVSFIGGAEESLSTLLKFLDRKKFDPFVVVPDHGALEQRLLKDNVRVKVIPWGHISRRFSRKNIFSFLFLPLVLPEIIILLIRLRRLAAQEKIDLIHTNGLKCHFLGAILSFCAKTKIVWHIREIYTFPIRMGLRFFRAFSSAEVIAISRAVKKGLGFGSSHVIYNGVDTRRFRPFNPDENLSERLGLVRGTKIITMHGILTSWKGHDIFLEAIAALYDTFPEIAGIIAGKELYTGIGHKGYFKYLKGKVEKLGIENRVRFLGFRDDMPYIINSSFALVHASLKPEPFGRVLIEAMACGKPIVASGGGAVEEIVRDRVDGLIVEKGDSAALAQALTFLIEDEDRAKDMGNNGRQRVEELFSAELMATNVEEFYFALLKFRGIIRG